ncbi:MAG TPA: hypothetical protein PKE12_10130 [Kiritimatiellia bacterium]|nr:hypothetical protein [Kiritimatiellia bacterium]
MTSKNHTPYRLLVTGHFFLLLFLAFALRAPAESGTPRDQARAILALRSAAGQVMAELEQRASTQSWDTAQLTEQLTTRMLADAAAHRRPQDSRTRSRTLAAELQKVALEAALTNAVAEAQARSPLPIRGEEVLELVGASWTQQVDAALARFLTNQFDAIYTGARLRAVALQQKTALNEIRFPAPEELDAHLLSLWQGRKDPAAVLAARDFDPLGGWLKSFAAPKAETLLEEVERHIGDAAARRKDEIIRQYEHQLGVIREAADRVPAGRITRAGIAAELQVALDRDLAARRQAAQDAGTAATPLYPVFQIVQSNALATAAQLEGARWSAFLAESGEPRIDAEALRKEIERAPAPHRIRATSETLFLETLGPAKQREAAAAYARKQGAPDAARAEFETQLAGAGEGARIFQARLREVLPAALETARARVVEKQIGQLDVLPGADPLPDPLIDALLAREARPVKTMDEALGFLGVRAKIDTSALLEETGARAVAIVNAAIAAGNEAVQAQAGLVRELETARREQLARDVAAARPVDAVLKEWTAEFTRQWKPRAAERNLRYDAPLAVTRELLNKTVRQLYDAVKQEQQSASATPAPGPAAVSPSENQRDEPDDKEEAAEVEQHTLEEVLLVPCDASLIIRDVGEQLCEAVMRVGPDAPPIVVRFAPHDADAAARALFDGIRPGLAGLVAGKQEAWKSGSRGFLGFKRRAVPELRFFMVVRSREIRHQTSLLLRSQISELLREWTEANHPGHPITLDWTVGLGAVASPE